MVAVANDTSSSICCKIVKMYGGRNLRRSPATTVLWWILSLCMLSTMTSLSVVMKIMLVWSNDIGITTRQQSILSNDQPYEFVSPTSKQPSLRLDTNASSFPFHATRSEPRSFPRWGATPQDEAQNGLDFGPLLDFIVNSSRFAYAPAKGFSDQRYQATTDHGTAIGRWYPEVLYILDSEGLSVSQLHRSIIEQKGENTLGYKMTPVERSMMAAWELLRAVPQEDSRRQWPHLSRVLLGKESVGFPFLLWHGDYTECNFQNWQQQYSIPLFTVAASVDCNYTFPFPNHMTVTSVDRTDWTEQMQQFQSLYPWESKVPQIVWRGSLTGKMVNATQRHARWQMLQRLQEMKQQHDAAKSDRPFLFDVGATRLPKQHQQYEPFLHEVGGIVEPMDMEDFQKFRGIIDLDGNSWSSRFGELLCYNSVVLKVEPQWVDYFYYSVHGKDRLQPWVHYIPVQSDLSDLVELSEFVVDPANDAILQDMVARANDWCRTHLVPRQVTVDMLDIWERYVALLDIGDAEWSTRQWPDVKRRLLQPVSPWRMNRTVVGTSPLR